MSLYVDSSAFLKRYLDEPDRATYVDTMASDDDLICARHTTVEVRRALACELTPADGAAMRARFKADLEVVGIVELDAAVCDLAADLAEATGARTLDALHFAAAQRTGGGALPFLTADVRQAQIARSLGWTVLGA